MEQTIIANKVSIHVNILNFSAILFYVAATFSQIRFLTDVSSYPTKKWLLPFGVIAVTLHAFILYNSMVNVVGINLGIFNAASLVTWVIALLLLLSVLHKPVENLAVILFPLAALTIGFDNFFHTERILAADKAFGVKLHIFSSILAYSLLTIAVLQAIFLAIQDNYLHNKHPSWVMKHLPPLQVMEHLFFQVMGIGFLLLTISLVSGFLFIQDIWEQHLVHKTVLSLIAWGMFSILLWGHLRYGWRGRKFIRWNLLSFIILMLAYFGSKLVLELILQVTLR